MKINPKVKNTVYQLSAILILFSAILYSFDTTVAKYAIIIGVIGFAITTFTTPYPGKSVKGKRLFNIQIFAVLLMAVAAFLMYINNGNWIVVLFVAALQTLFCAIRLPQIYKKEQQEDKD